MGLHFSLVIVFALFYSAVCDDKSMKVPRVIPVPVPIPMPIHHHHHYGPVGAIPQPNSAHAYGQWDAGLWPPQETQEVGYFDPHGLRDLEMGGPMNPPAAYRFPFHGGGEKVRPKYYPGETKGEYRHIRARRKPVRPEPEAAPQLRPEGFSDQPWRRAA